MSAKSSRLELLEHRCVLAGDIVISEFMASNQDGLIDEDGHTSDWIELHNTSGAPVNLQGWFLTDKRDQLTRWQLPSTTIAAGDYLIVYASDKDKRDAGELHTNFKLNAGGDYLALVRPNLEIEHEYTSSYPEQYDNVSYGLGEGFEEQVLVTAGAPGKFIVPTAGNPVGNWRTTGFNDSSWASVTTGVGYQNANGGPNSPPLAYWTFDGTTSDASGNGYDATLVGAAGYAADAPSQLGGGQSLSLAGTQPAPQYAMVTNIEELSETEMTVSMWFKGTTNSRGIFSAYAGNGVAGNDRSLWLQGSNIAGQLKGGPFAENIVSTSKTYSDNAWHHLVYVFKQGQTSQRIYVDGVQVASGTVSSSVVTNQDRINIGLAPPALVDPFAGQIDDVAIWNVALSSTAISALHSGVSPNELQSYASNISSNVDAIMDGINSSAYLRVPFNVPNVAEHDSLTLRMRYDDGFIAYLNGVEVARRNAPGSPAWNSTATDRHPNGQAVVYEQIDISAHVGALQNGANVLAIHGLNIAANDNDFLISPELVDIDSVGIVEQFYAVPTPGAPNSTQLFNPVADPEISVDSKVITSDTVVTITSDSPGAAIYYTTNGAIPSQQSTLYTGPITVSNTTRIRARVFKDFHSPSRVVSEFYTRIASDALSFSSELPVVVVDSYGIGAGNFSATTLSPVTAHFLKNPGGRTTLTGPDDVSLRAGMRIRGQASEGFPKHQYAFEVWDELDRDKDASLLGMPESPDWILYGPYTEKAHIHQALAYELSNQIGRYAPRTEWVEMFINSDNQLTASDYVGLYILMEKITADPDRVDIDKMGPLDNSGEDVTGGYIFSFDKDDADGNDKFTTMAAGAVPAYSFHRVEPDAFEWTIAQKSYLTNYMNEFATVLAGPNFADPVTGYAAYIDVQSFIDYILMVELAKNIDGYRISTFYHKDRGGKVAMGPIWDFELAFSNANYLAGWDPAGWYINSIDNGNKPYLGRLMQDPNFVQQLVDTWNAYRDDAWSTDELLDTTYGHVNEIYEAGVRDHARWGNLGTYLWPNIYFGIGDPPHAGQANNHPARTYRDEVQVVRQWLHDRVFWMDNQFVRPPSISPGGGNVLGGSQVTISVDGAPGTLYYTVDGSDPRLPGGGVSPTAQIYSGPITISSNTKVTARLKSNTVDANLMNDWSAPAEQVFVVDAPDLIVSEIMFHPAIPGVATPYTREDFEYVEVQNVGTTPINLSGYRFDQGIDFTFPNVTLNPGQFGVVVRNPAAFATRYPGVTPIGTFTGGLDNNGDDLRLVSPIGIELFDGQFDDSWHRHTDGDGFSLVTTYQGSGGGALYNSGEASDQWRASQLRGGNPGAADTGLQKGSLVINEVNSVSDWVEIYNPTSSAIDLMGWYLSDSRSNLTKLQISNSTIIPAGDYLVLEPMGTFGLSKDGETVYLSSPGTGGIPGGFRIEQEFGAIDVDGTFGRISNTWEDGDFPLLANATPWSANTAAAVGPVVISEIMYNPQRTILWQPVGVPKDEFIEIQNISASAVDLFDPTDPSKTWQFSGSASFAFPAGQSLAAGERALIVPIAPAAFRTKYSIPAAVKIYGPWTGALDDHRSAIELNRASAEDDSVRITVDRVVYADHSPWSPYADGKGPSLSKVNLASYGNDPANWQASHTGGTPGAANTFIDLTPPSAVSNLTKTFTGVGTTNPRTHISWTAATDAESGIAYYNIYRRGSATDPIRAESFHVGTESGTLFVDNTVFLGPAFDYQVSAVNGDGVEGPRSPLQFFPPVAVEDAYRTNRGEPLVTTNQVDTPVQLLPAGSTWRYLVTAADPGQDWNDENFNHASWPDGLAELGYSSNEPPEATVIGFGPDTNNKYATTYFRKTFTIADLAEFDSLTLRLKRDDGAAVWINGIERIRDGLSGTPGIDPPVPYGYSLVAVGDDGAGFNNHSINPAWLKNGLNTIAVQVHQSAGNSSDLSFDLALEGHQRRTGLLANDEDQGRGPLTAVKLTNPTNGQITQFNSDGTFTYVPNAGFGGTDTFTYKVVDSQNTESAPATVTIQVVPMSAVVGRHIFYNDSRYDSIGPGFPDDNAIATDKTALLPGGTATFANYTSFNKGINGIVIDIDNLPGPINFNDLEFRVGNDNTPHDWTAPPSPSSMSIRPNAGVAGADRISIIFPNNAVMNQWLQVTVKANERTGLLYPDVFYFGNAIGESGNSQFDAGVTVSDEVAARNNPYSGQINPAPITNRWDYNRDGSVTVSDQVIARNNLTTVATRLKLISIPIPLQSSPLVASSLTAQQLVDAAVAEEADSIPQGTGSSLSGSTMAPTLRTATKAVDSVMAAADDFAEPARRRPVRKEAMAE